MLSTKKYIYLFSVFFFLMPLSYAQKNHTLNGIVKDKATAETLVGATVKLSGNKKLTTATNGYGFYSLNIPDGNYKIEISYVGYTTITQQITINGDVKLDFNLQLSNDLAEVTITRTKRNDNILRPQMGIEKLNVKDIQNVPVLFGERDILKTQVLQTFVDGKKVHQENEKKRTGIAIVLADDNEK